MIQGVSAGAGSVAHHLTAYGGADQTLFHAAIVESLFLPTQPSVPELEWQLDRLLTQTGCDDMSCLRGKDLGALQAFNVPSAFPGRTAAPLPLFYWGPCIDRNFSQDYIYNLFDQGNFVDVPILIGTDNDGEFTTYSENFLRQKILTITFPQRARTLAPTPRPRTRSPSSCRTTTPI